MSSSDSDYSETGTSESCSDICSSIETAESESNEEFLYDEDLEPVATEEERNAYEEQVAAEEAKNLELQRRFRGETNVHSWCSCSHCSVELITKPEECLCCREINRCQEKLSEAEHTEVQCINTLHPGFWAVCMDRWVLQIAAFGLKTRKNRRYIALRMKGLATESQFFRSVSYRKFFRLVWGYTGCSKRIPLPCCVYNAIRAEFPSEQGDYHGFEADELEHSAEQEEHAEN